MRSNSAQVISPFKAILEYEVKHGIPTGYINYSIRELTPNGAWHKLERGEIKCDENYFRQFKADLERPEIWERYHREKLNTNTIPAIPNIDAEGLYFTMMSTAQEPDPYMYPALKKLKASGHFKMAALSNTTIYPEGHPLSTRRKGDDVRTIFELFVSSAHVGMRKPYRDIYEYTLGQIRQLWGTDIQPQDICFLDDIGENLKMARSMGIRTIRVFLGKTDNAVRELEQVTGMQLLDSAKAKL